MSDRSSDVQREDAALVDAIEVAVDRAFDRFMGPQDYRPPEVLVAQAIVADVGLEPAGQGWCPVHGDALCPEQYMLFRDGRIAPGYSQFWSEDIRCGKRLATYRSTVVFGRQLQDGSG